MLDHANQLTAGVKNVLLDCAGCRPGDKVLIVREDMGDGYYDPSLAQAVAHEAAALGIAAALHDVPLHPDAIAVPSDLKAQMDAACCTVFFARIGDQIRFRPSDTKSPCVVSYALDREMLGSPFGTVPFDAFAQLKTLINIAIAQAEEIHVTCPLGTDFRGAAQDHGSDRTADVTIQRFPISVFSPVASRQFAGRVAQAGFLVGTGARYYQPYSCPLEDTVFFTFKGNDLIDVEGSDHDVTAVRTHYDFVSGLYGLSPNFVHSWHAGIHPGCRFSGTAGHALERWSGGAFGNPRLLHFHTCGAEPPGEISWNVLDPTIRMDGVAVWENGVLHPDRIAGGIGLLDTYPEMAACFATPETEVGQSADGRLRSSAPDGHPPQL